MNKTIIAMSGGVDSSVAALLVKESGADALGVTLKMYDSGRLTCGSGMDAQDAKAVADKLNMPHEVWDYGSCFIENVVENFVQSYINGETPNPCVVCNRYVKFGKMVDDALRLGFDKVVTGHYARIDQDENGRFLLKKAADPKKDQSYFLYGLTQTQLAHAWFPLGGMTKDEARQIAEEHGFVNAQKRDSQDICFIPDGDYGSFIETYLGKSFPEGDFVDSNGKVLGRHKGLIRYTIGKRKGLGLALPCPMYVKKLNWENNTVELCLNEELFSTELTARDVNLISVPEIKGEMRVRAKVRSAKTEMPASVYQTDDHKIRVIFDEPQCAVTPGQSVVLYDGDTVVGGGIIE